MTPSLVSFCKGQQHDRAFRHRQLSRLLVILVSLGPQKVMPWTRTWHALVGSFKHAK